MVRMKLQHNWRSLVEANFRNGHIIQTHNKARQAVVGTTSTTTNSTKRKDYLIRPPSSAHYLSWWRASSPYKMSKHVMNHHHHRYSVGDYSPCWLMSNNIKGKKRKWTDYAAALCSHRRAWDSQMPTPLPWPMAKSVSRLNLVSDASVK